MNLVTARVLLGEGAYFGAAVLGRLGAWLQGLDVKMDRPHVEGETSVTLTGPIPRLVRGLRLDSGDLGQVVKVKSVRGRTVSLDRPLACNYPAGATVKVLV